MVTETFPRLAEKAMMWVLAIVGRQQLSTEKWKIKELAIIARTLLQIITLAKWLSIASYNHDSAEKQEEKLHLRSSFSLVLSDASSLCWFTFIETHLE